MTDVWDKTTPVGSEAISLGDDRIREAKSALEAALSHEGTFPGASPSTAPIFIPGFLRGNTAARPTVNDLVSGRFYCNTTLNVIERYNGATWDAVATLIPVGTKMVFYQASAPTGWTAVTLDDKFLRVVNSGGSGGTSGGSGLTPSATVTLAHSHSVNGHTHTMANHIHAVPNHIHVLEGSVVSKNFGGTRLPIVSADSNGSELYSEGSITPTNVRWNQNVTKTDGGVNTGAPDTNTTGSTTGDTDSQLSNTAFQYASCIIATKD